MYSRDQTILIMVTMVMIAMMMMIIIMIMMMMPMIRRYFIDKFLIYSYVLDITALISFFFSLYLSLACGAIHWILLLL